jgi:hypothetical protein
MGAALPAAVGVDSVKLRAAIDYTLEHGGTWDFERDQVRTFGPPLGPLPRTRASTNGVVLRHGYVIATFGDTKANDPVYSIAKSVLSTVAALAVQRGLIRGVNDRVSEYPITTSSWCGVGFRTTPWTGSFSASRRQ